MSFMIRNNEWMKNVQSTFHGIFCLLYTVHTETFIIGFHRSEKSSFTACDWMNNLFSHSAGEIDVLIFQSLNLQHSKLAIHVFQLHEDGPATEELEEDIAAANHWLLPSGMCTLSCHSQAVWLPRPYDMISMGCLDYTGLDTVTNMVANTNNILHKLLWLKCPWQSQNSDWPLLIRTSLDEKCNYMFSRFRALLYPSNLALQPYARTILPYLTWTYTNYISIGVLQWLTFHLLQILFPDIVYTAEFHGMWEHLIFDSDVKAKVRFCKENSSVNWKVLPGQHHKSWAIGTLD